MFELFRQDALNEAAGKIRNENLSIKEVLEIMDNTVSAHAVHDETLVFLLKKVSQLEEQIAHLKKTTLSTETY